MIAHIVGGGSPWQLWPTCTLLLGGAVAAMFVRRPRLHRVCLAATALGGVATIVIYVLLPAAPAAPPGLTLSIVAPLPGAPVTSPVVIRVCDGAASVPGAGRLLGISVDGRQVAELNTGMVAFNAAAGENSVRAELVTSDHREYAPPLVTNETITVSGVGPLSQPPNCPGVAVATP